jgi:hypothetical protein
MNKYNNAVNNSEEIISTLEQTRELRYMALSAMDI